MKIYFDEAGNSGQNLLDTNQPVFVIASHNFSEEEVRKIIKPIESSGEELHFNKIRKFKKQQEQVIKSLNHRLITSKRVKMVYYDKRFALIAHLVDQLIETSFYHRGIDLYKKGLNISYANSIYYLGENIWNKDLNEKFLENFQKMIREKSKESIETFYLSANLLHNSVKGYEKEILEPVLVSELYINSILESIRKYSIDLTLPSITLLSDSWFKEIGKTFEIVHDDSKQVEFWKNFISYLSKGNEKVEVGYDYRKMTYPLAINSVNLASSKKIIQIQLADIIASSLAYCVKKIHIEKELENEFAKNILNSSIGRIKAHPIMPSDKLTPKQLKTQNDKGINPLDYLAFKALQSGEEFDQAFG